MQHTHHMRSGLHTNPGTVPYCLATLGDAPRAVAVAGGVLAQLVDDGEGGVRLEDEHVGVAHVLLLVAL